MTLTRWLGRAQRALRARALLGALIALLLPVAAAAGNEIPASVAECLDCHAEDDVMELGDGSERSILVDGEAFMASVHGSEVVCTDCHERYDEDHPGVTAATARDYVIDHYGVCKKCHFDTYTRTLESVHYEYLKDGLKKAPVCTDCHGAHDIQNPHQKHWMLSRSCAGCHQDVYDKYATSVHGRALLSDASEDVPSCASCHTHHSIDHPNTVRFHLASPETCIGCHGDEEMMERYDIPTDVATTYLRDFHGVTASLGQEAKAKDVVVTCVDCHGVHDIASPALVGDEQMKEQVAATCASCHQDAAEDFPAAWLSHFMPSLKHAPLVFLVDLFYKIFIPFVVLGVILQVVLHQYRVAVRR